jgi:hypothetical protein
MVDFFFLLGGLSGNSTLTLDDFSFWMWETMSGTTPEDVGDRAIEGGGGAEEPWKMQIVSLKWQLQRGSRK